MSPTPPTLVLTGMMATGKTSVGRELARRLGRPFTDLDAVVEGAAGMSIADIFAREGDAGFRARERAAVAALDGATHAVIATGGWTMGEARNRTFLESIGRVVCLTATPEALVSRLGAVDVAARPRLAGAPILERVRTILDERRPVYDSVPLQVDTTARDVPVVADAVLALVAATEGLDVRALPVRTPSGGYPVLIGNGLTDASGPLLVARGIGNGVAIVTDTTVSRLYCARVRDAAARAGMQPAVIEIPAGETAKTMDTVSALYRAFLDADLDRGGTVVALGGGVVGDTAGMAAATYLRGVRFVPVPTTLLAMVDASIGGKVGVNLPEGKNLVGAFHHPALVVADPSVLATLPEPTLRDGLAEVVKAALVGDADLLADLADHGPPDRVDAPGWAALILRAVAVKAAIVAEDPHEHGRRALLNLGHTFAHGLELATGYRISHGAAVAVGLVAATRLAVRLGLAAPSLSVDVTGVLDRLGLPTAYHGSPADAVLAAMRPDKKRRDGRLRFVLPRAVGDVVVVDDVATADVLAVLGTVRVP
jgi:shikimate kinase / 3-dehydroquinate synthase